MTKYKRGLRHDLIEYFYAYPGGIINIQELETHFKGTWSHMQIAQAMAEIVRQGDTPINRIQQHVWQLLEEPSQELIAAKVLPPKEEATKDIYDMNVTVVKSSDDGTELVVVDDFTNIWRMVKVG